MFFSKSPSISIHINRSSRHDAHNGETIDQNHNHQKRPQQRALGTKWTNPGMNPQPNKFGINPFGMFQFKRGVIGLLKENDNNLKHKNTPTLPLDLHLDPTSCLIPLDKKLTL